MTISLVTGHAGTNHITSAQIGGFNSAWYGHRTIRLPNLTTSGSDTPLASDHPTNDGVDMTWPVVTVSGTTATIPVGQWLCNGRLIQVDAPVTVELATKQSGVSRVDILYFKFTVDDSGIESVSAEAVCGDIDLTAQPVQMLWPNAPQTTACAIARLDWDANAATPKVTMAGARHFPEDYVTAMKWQELGGTWHFEQHGNVCVLHAYAVHVPRSANNWTRKILDTKLNHWSWPNEERTCPLMINNGGDTTSYMGVYPDGTIALGHSGSSYTGDACYGTLTWVVI